MLLKTKDRIFYPTMLMMANGLYDVKYTHSRAAGRRIHARALSTSPQNPRVAGSWALPLDNADARCLICRAELQRGRKRGGQISDRRIGRISGLEPKM